MIDEKSCPEAKTVTDHEGNLYATVKIGNQCWMRDNLRTKHDANGVPIPAGGTTTSETSPYYYDYTASNIDLKDRGLLYNWSAAKIVCPTGWHLPSDAEWNIMEKFVSGSDTMNVNFNATDWRGTHAGKLAGGDKWQSSTNNNAPGNMDYAERNASGFSAVPAGGCNGLLFGGAGVLAYFWASAQGGSFAWGRDLNYGNASVARGYPNESRGFSARCVKD